MINKIRQKQLIFLSLYLSYKLKFPVFIEWRNYGG
jgi:hypothetical protein